MCQKKEIEAQKQKEINTQVSAVKEKNVSGNVIGAPVNEETKEKDAPRISKMPQEAIEKNGGFFGFFHRSKVTARMAPNEEPQNEQEQQANQVQQEKRHTFERAVVDLTEVERGGKSVAMMRDSKSFLAEKAQADLMAERKVPLSDFVKNLLVSIKALGKTDESRFPNYKDKVAARNTETQAAKNCLPFLLKFMDDTDCLEANLKDKAIAAEYQKEYGNLTEEEMRLIRIYAEHLRDVRGILEVKGGKQGVVTDKDMKGPGASSTDIKVGNKKNGTLEKSALKFKDRTDEPLFKHQPCIYDMKQGNIGDCYLISALISLVNADSDVIRGCMKDNGKTVTVRFFHKKTPIYITVDKTTPYRTITKTEGQKVTQIDEEYGSKGALWVGMMEKAYAAFLGNDYSQLVGQDAYGASDFIRSLTGKEFVTEEMAGNILTRKQELLDELPTKKTMKQLMENMRKGERAAFEERLRKENKLPAKKKERNRLWNEEKARIFFGLEKDGFTPEVEYMFRKNTAFTQWRRFFEQQIEKFTDSGIRTMSEFNAFWSKIEWDKLPKVGIPGVDEKKAQENFIKSFNKYITKRKPLFGIFNNYIYSDEENAFFDRITKAKKDGKFMSTGTNRLRFQGKKSSQTEAAQEGIYSNHAFALLGTKEEEIKVDNKKYKRKFVILANPWQHTGRIYTDDGGGTNVESKVDSSGQVLYDNHGIFMMELKEFRMSFCSVEYQ